MTDTWSIGLYYNIIYEMTTAIMLRTFMVGVTVIDVSFENRPHIMKIYGISLIACKETMLFI